MPPEWSDENVHQLSIEREMRFPWRGGCHPWLDVAIDTASFLIGIESKRFEPFRNDKPNSKFSKTYSKSCWGDNMKGYENMRDQLQGKTICFSHVNAAQLVKHACGIYTQAKKSGVRPVLVYLYAEPACFPTGVSINETERTIHKNEITCFAKQVDGDEVRFICCSYRALIAHWKNGDLADVRTHADAVLQRYES